MTRRFNSPIILKNSFQNILDSKLTNDYFVHLRLTDILNMHEIQSILLKFWHLAYSFDNHKTGLASKINFSNCFIYEMEVESYKQYFYCINEALKLMINHKNFNVISNYLSTTNTKTVSYETFGLHILQIFGNLIKQLNENQLLVILRRVYFAISKFDTVGKAQVKNFQEINPIQVNDIFYSQSRLRSRSNIRTPTKLIDENEDHLPSLLESQQKLEARTSNSKKQQRLINFNNPQDIRIDTANNNNNTNNNINYEQQFQENAREEDVLANLNVTNIHFAQNQQIPASANKNQNMTNNNIQLNGTSYQQQNNQSMQKTKMQLFSPSQNNQNTSTSLNNNFQDFFQPYHMRPQPLKKIPTSKDKMYPQEQLTLQNSSKLGLTDSKDYKQRSQSYQQYQTWGNTTMKDRFDRKVKAIQQNDKIRSELNNSFSACYPCEEKMKYQQKTNLSSFILGGYDIIDYSDTINKLHRKLLRKIVLNR